jgi:hypothetical protein
MSPTGTPERLRGVIASATENSVTVDPYAGKPVTVALTGKSTYLKVERSSLTTATGYGRAGLHNCSLPFCARSTSSPSCQESRRFQAWL